MKDERIAVAGAGIGGLAVALALAQVGYDVVVLEKASTLGELGAGIQLGPNAFHAFDCLGLGEAIRSMAVFIDELKLMDAISGAAITNIPLGDEFRGRFQNPYAVVHRGDLHGVLLGACNSSEKIDLRVNAAVVSYESTDEEVVVSLGSGESVTARALIGADGLWSSVRKKLVNDGAPRVSGHTTYRSVIPTENMPDELRWNAACLWAGPKCHVVHYPLSGWKVFNLVATRHNDAKEPVAGDPVSTKYVLDQFTHVHECVQSIIRHGSNWKRWVLCDREPIEKFNDGRVALLGDAAHPTLQYLAQGACMALEDAIALSACVAGNPTNISQALAAYSDARRLRTARVQLMSRAVGEHIYHPAGAHAALRNDVMKKMRPVDYYDDLQWLYGQRENARHLS